VQASANFVFGVKMHHLAQENNNVYRSCMDQHISRLGTGSNCLFTIGEIDCRPDEGIWNAVKRHKKNMEEVIHATVSGYINYIKNRLITKEVKWVIIQGVPAPGYSLHSKILLEEEKMFLKMIKCVNEKLQLESTQAGFAFFDVYAATVGQNGFGNKIWHIDEYHLKPTIYDNLDKWLILQ
jgi:predicted enzyme involved in methoxymalonyl-ACP biosynthesis